MSARFITLALALVLAYPAGAADDHDLAVVVANGVNLRDKPSTDGSVLGQLDFGAVVTVVAKTDSPLSGMDPDSLDRSWRGYRWYEVRTDAGKQGWLYGEFLGFDVAGDHIDAAHHEDHPQHHWLKDVCGQATKEAGKRADVDGDGKQDVLWMAVTADGRLTVPMVRVADGRSIALDVRIPLPEECSLSYPMDLRFGEVTADAGAEMIWRLIIVCYGECLEEHVLVAQAHEGRCRRIWATFSGPDDFGDRSFYRDVDVVDGALRLHAFKVSPLESLGGESLAAAAPSGSTVRLALELTTTVHAWHEDAGLLTSAVSRRASIRATPAGDELTVRDYPDQDGKVLHQLAGGTQVQVTEMLIVYPYESDVPNPWLHVEGEEGVRGWVRCAELEFELAAAAQAVREDLVDNP